MYGNVAFNPTMGGIGYRGPSGIPGTPVTKTSNVRPGVKFHTPRSAGAQMLPGKMRQAQASAVAASRRARATSGANVTGKKMTQQAANSGGGIMGKIGNMSRRSKIGIGLGLGIAAAVTMDRRGPGASSGRQSIYKY